MRLDIYVNYRGHCEQAFRLYEQHLGGRITGIVRHREQPDPGLAADWQEKVLHARIEIGTTVLMGADIPQAEPMRSAYLTLSLDVARHSMSFEPPPLRGAAQFRLYVRSVI